MYCLLPHCYLPQWLLDFAAPGYHQLVFKERNSDDTGIGGKKTKQRPDEKMAPSGLLHLPYPTLSNDRRTGARRNSIVAAKIFNFNIIQKRPQTRKKKTLKVPTFPFFKCIFLLL